MSMPITGSAKVDIAIAPSSYTGGSAQTSSYYNMKDYEKVIFICMAGSMTASGNVPMRLVQAPTSTAPSAAIAIGTAATMNGTPTDAETITKAIEIVIRGSSQGGFAHNESITVNSKVFTFQTSSGGTAAPTTATFNSNLYICSSSSFVTPYDTIAHLAAYINHATYGCTGVVATISSATSYLTLTVTPPGEKTLTVVVSDSSLVAYPTQMIGYLEVDGSEFAASSSQDHVALEVTPSTHQRLAAMAIRYKGRYSIDRGHMVTAYDDIV